MLWSVYPQACSGLTLANPPAPLQQFLVFLGQCQRPPNVDRLYVGGKPVTPSALGRRRLGPISPPIGVPHQQPDLINTNTSFSFEFEVVENADGTYNLTGLFYEGNLDCQGTPAYAFTTPVGVGTEGHGRGYNTCGDVTPLGGTQNGRRLQSSSSNSYVVVGSVSSSVTAPTSGAPTPSSGFMSAVHAAALILVVWVSLVVY